MNEDKPLGNLTLMLRVADAARADIALTPDRVYYRFATDESIEDGELPGLKDGFAEFAGRVLDELAARENETALADEIKVSVFINNRVSQQKISEQSLRRLVDALKETADEFAFLNGFC